MEQTSNYQLNQWAESDRILRTDFNSDNAKIDAALSNIGDCKIEVGSYVGTGAYGASQPNSLTFSGEPLVVLIFGSGGPAIFPKSGQSVQIQSSSNYPITATFGSNTLTWYFVSNAVTQMNVLGVTYYYLAFLETK